MQGNVSTHQSLPSIPGETAANGSKQLQQQSSTASGKVMQRINSIRNGSGRALTRRMFTSQMSVSKSESTACGGGGGVGGQPPSADGEMFVENARV